MDSGGRALGGRYRLVELIGKGGMGEVFLAQDQVLGRRVAIKQIPTGSATGEDRATAVNRLIREARAAAQIHHPHVVTVHDVIVEDGQTYVVMEYVAALNLAQLVRRDGRLSPAQAASVGSQVAEALEAAHRLGITHRDVKPANILLTADGFAKLADFGVAQAAGDASLTRAGNLIGSVAFMAPEVARGGAATAASDVYSLGSTLYAVIEGRPPFFREGESSDSVAMLPRLISEPAPFSRAGGLVSPIIAAMLHPDPAMRPTAAALHGHLARLSGGPTPLTSDSASPTTGPSQGPAPLSFPYPGDTPTPAPDATVLRSANTPRELAPPPTKRRFSAKAAWIIGTAVVIAGLIAALVLALAPPGFWWHVQGEATCEGPALKVVQLASSFGTTTIRVTGDLKPGQELEVSVWTIPGGSRILLATYNVSNAVTMLSWDAGEGYRNDPTATPSTFTGGVYTLTFPSSLIDDKGGIGFDVSLDTLDSAGEYVSGESCTALDIPIR